MKKLVGYFLPGLLGMTVFVITFFLLRLALNFLPDLSLWKGSSPLFTVGAISLAYADLLYFLFGFIVTTHGVINLFRITKEKNQGADPETGKPARLITNGFYSKARHPMYGTFIMINLGFFLSTRSLWGVFVILLVSVVQNLNAHFEEKNELLKIFGESYQTYQNQVKHTLLLPAYRVYAIIAMILTIVGFFVS